MYAESFIALVSLLAVHTASEPGVSVLPLQTLPTAKYVAPQAPAPLLKDQDAFGMDVTARSAVVMDVGSGAILFQKGADQVYPVASLTKLVTAMTFLDAQPNLDEEVTVIGEDNPRETSAVFLSGERMTKRDLLRSLLVGSVNMSANALARSTGDRDAFIRSMNAKARELGLEHASFVDPVGISARNQASARDMAIVLHSALAYPDIRSATELDRVEIKGRLNGRVYVVKSTNLLLGSYLNKAPFHIVAAKTGSLPEAGYCFAQVTRNDEGREVAVVVLGSENHFSRFQDAKALTFWAFDHFEWPKRSADWGSVSVR